MPASPKHRVSIIDAAIALFRRQGYSATGLNDIVQRSGAPKGSLYHYFPEGKASIAETAVREAGRRVAITMREIAAHSQSAQELLKAHAALLAGWMEQSGFRDGCPITTVLLELAPGNEAVTQAGREAYAVRQQVMAERLIADGVPRQRAERLAVLCVAALQGALIQARVEKSGLPIHIAAEELGTLIPTRQGRQRNKAAVNAEPPSKLV